MNKVKSTDPKYRICYCAKKYCKDDISLIENYSEMMADTAQVWCCHHRREISENKSYKQLIAEGRYYKVPACELIFMTVSDHNSLHMKLRMTGVPRSEETKQKISEALSGVPKSEASKQKMSEAKIGRHWYNNGVNEVLAKECPGEGFILGRIRKETSL